MSFNKHSKYVLNRAIRQVRWIVHTTTRWTYTIAFICAFRFAFLTIPTMSKTTLHLDSASLLPLLALALSKFKHALLEKAHIHCVTPSQVALQAVVRTNLFNSTHLTSILLYNTSTEWWITLSYRLFRKTVLGFLISKWLNLIAV